MATISTINVNNIELSTDDNIEFSGAFNNKNFKITKDINAEGSEYSFTLDVENNNFYTIYGTYSSIEEAINALK